MARNGECRVDHPLSHVVDAARAHFNGQITDAVVRRGMIILVVLTVLAMWWAAIIPSGDRISV